MHRHVFIGCFMAVDLGSVKLTQGSRQMSEISFVEFVVKDPTNVISNVSVNEMTKSATITQHNVTLPTENKVKTKQLKPLPK